jgi:Ca2+-binding RTX toxin-like protein
MLNKSSRRLALVGSGVTLAALFAAVALAATVSCAGGGPVCEGTNQPDDITGTNNRDVIFAKKGSDRVEARSGKDELNGQGGGETLLEGENGNDDYFGGNGADVLSESGDHTGKDRMFGGDDPDYLEGGLESDELHGGGGSERDAIEPAGMYGDAGNDDIFGEGGRDAMEGEEGDDELFGGRKNDFIDAKDDESVDGRDKVNCGRGGNDVALVNENDQVTNCEDVTEFPNPT